MYGREKVDVVKRGIASVPAANMISLYNLKLFYIRSQNNNWMHISSLFKVLNLKQRIQIKSTYMCRDNMKLEVTLFSTIDEILHTQFNIFRVTAISVISSQSRQHKIFNQFIWNKSQFLWFWKRVSNNYPYKFKYIYIFS